MNHSSFNSQNSRVLSIFALSLALAGCGSSSNDDGGITDTPNGVTDNMDWTGQACESPAIRNVLGTYTGELQFLDDSARSCRWSAEIIINGINEPDTAVCNLFGSVTSVLLEQGTQLDGDPYICSEGSIQNEFASGLQDGLDLNIATVNSLILQLDEAMIGVDNNGLTQVSAVTQFEALTVGGGNLVAVNGTLVRQN